MTCNDFTTDHSEWFSAIPITTTTAKSKATISNGVQGKASNMAMEMGVGS